MSSRRLSVVLELDTGRYSGRIGAAGAQMKVFSGTVNSTSTSVKRLQGSFDTLNSRMSTPLQKLRDYVLILGNIRMAILNVRDIAVGWVGALLKQSAEVERLTILMKGLSTELTEVGKERDAERNLSRLFDMARKNGFAVKELADAFIKLKTGGIDPMNGSLQSLTDAVAKFGGGSDVMHRASIAIQQMAGKGVISMEELRQQLGEAVPTAMWDMARAAGMSMQQFVDAVSKGKIQAKPALQLMFQEFERMYSGAGEKKGKTLLGQIEQFKTNMTLLSTAFSGMASGQTSSLRAYMEEQKALFQQGKITREAFEASQQSGGAGMFADTAEAMRQINEAMRSDEARIFMRDLGDGVNWVMQKLMGLGKFIVRWRTEIGGAIIGLVTAFAAVKAVQLGQWFYQLGATALTTVRNISTGVQPLPGVMQSWKNSLSGVAESYTRLQNVQQLRIQRLREEITGANQFQAVAQRRIMQLKQESAAYRQNLQMLAQQRAQQVAQLRTAQTLHAANLSQGRSAVQSAMAVKAAQDALNATRRSQISIGRTLAATEAAITTAQRLSAAAASSATAATGRLTTATAATTWALRASAAAARLAAGAVTFLGRAMSIALGPIGMIAMALYAAAEAAGVFENRADRAAEATARLMQGMGDLADMKTALASRNAAGDDFRNVTDRLNQGGRWVTTDIGDHKKSRRFIKDTPEERAALLRRREGAAGKWRQNQEALKRGQFTQREQSVNNYMTGSDQARQEYFGKIDSDYQVGVASGKITEKNSAQYIQRANAMKLAWHEQEVTRAVNARNAAIARGADPRQYNMLLSRTTEARDSFKSMHGDVNDLREAMVGAGKETGKGTKKLTEAEKAARKAAREQERLAKAYENTREKYDRMLDGQVGEIASLEEQLAGGDKKGTAKFEALKEAGFYADATNKELEEMAKNFARIDELNEQINFQKSLGSLRKEISKTAEEATQLWAAFDNNSWDANQRDAQYKSRFAPLLEGVTDPARIAEINAGIEEAIENIKKADAAEIAHGWLRAAEDIEASLLSENEARQRNFDAEVARQQALIALTKEGSEERIKAQAAFERWRRASEMRLARENETSTQKMARDWAKLGQHIDRALAGALNSFVDGMFNANFSFKDFTVGIIKELVKIILKAMIAYAILSAIGMANNSAGQPVSFKQFLGGQISAGFGGGSTAGTDIGFGTQGAPGRDPLAPLPAGDGRYHTGGWLGRRPLKPGEVPFIGLEDEVVLTKDQQAKLGEMMGGGAGGQPNVSVNIINNSGTQLDAEQSEPQFNGREMIVNVIVEAAQKQGPLRDVLSQVGKSG